MGQRTGELPAEFGVAWTIGDVLHEAEPDTLEIFLIEPYCLYSSDGENPYRSRTHRRLLPLQQAELLSCRSSMIESHGLPARENDPLLDYAEALEVSIWPLEKVE